jgi:hypothetical protein
MVTDVLGQPISPIFKGRWSKKKFLGKNKDQNAQEQGTTKQA